MEWWVEVLRTSTRITGYTFTAEHLHMRPYVMWLRDTISQQQGGSSSSASSTSDSGGGEGGDGEGQQEAPVRWRLTDINFVVQDYVPPAKRPNHPRWSTKAINTQLGDVWARGVTLVHTLYKLGKREAERRQARPLGMPPIGGGLQPRRPLGGMPAAADGGMGGGAGSTSSLCSVISRRHGRAAMVVVALVHCAEEAVEEVEA